MHLRPCVREDVSACASIMGDAFLYDQFMAFRVPYRLDYPYSWRRYCVEKQHGGLCQPGTWGIVCVSDGEDGLGTKDEVLGHAVWVRKVPDAAIETDKYLQNYRNLSSAIERFLRSIETTYKNWLLPNPCQCSSTNDVIARSFADDGLLAPLEQATYWLLAGLVVSPKHQRKGVGRMLVDWGVQKATEESLAAPEKPPIPVMLVASEHGAGLYKQLGFRIFAWKNGIVEGWHRAMELDPERRRKELYAIYDRVLSEIGHTTDKGGSCMLFESRKYWIEQVNVSTLVNGKEVQAVWTQNALERASKGIAAPLDTAL